MFVSNIWDITILKPILEELPTKISMSQWQVPRVPDIWDYDYTYHFASEF